MDTGWSFHLQTKRKPRRSFLLLHYICIHVLLVLHDEMKIKDILTGQINYILVVMKIGYTDYKHFAIVFFCYKFMGSNCTNPEVSEMK